MNDKIKMRNKFIFSINPKKYVYLYKEKLSKAFLYVLVLALIIGLIQGVWDCSYFWFRKNYKNDFRSKMKFNLK